MEREKSWEKITQTGNAIRQGWQVLADKYDLPVKHWGLPALTGFTFDSPWALEYKSLLSQEMLARGYLAANSVYVCTEHSKGVVDGYFDSLDPIFGLIRDCEDGRDVTDLLNGPVCHGGFARLN